MLKGDQPYLPAPNRNSEDYFVKPCQVQGPSIILRKDSKGNPRSITNSKGRKRKPGSKYLAMAIRCTDKLFVDFISQCLVWDPTKRMTPEKALRHEWLKGLGSTGSSTGLSGSAEVKRSVSAAGQDQKLIPVLYRNRTTSTSTSTSTTAKPSELNLDDSGTFLPPIL